MSRLVSSHVSRLQRRQCSMYHTGVHAAPAPTKIVKIVVDSIKSTGPMSFATYMQLCLTHPTEGYYTRSSNAVFGTQGDFVTSPEISQVFGELIGIWFLSQWKNATLDQRHDPRKGFRLVELGPGRGTLMKDILRVISQFPSAQSSLRSVHLVETSASMRSMQKNALLPSSPRNETDWEIIWHDAIDDVPRSTGDGEYTMLVAHEFFDALPVHVLEKTHKGWQEVLISLRPDPPSPALNQSAQSSQSRLYPVLSPSPSPLSTILGLSSLRFKNLPIGARIEVSPSAFKIARRVGELVSASVDSHLNEEKRCVDNEAGRGAGGAALIIDYGGEKAFGNSLRAFKDHKIVDVFHRPGECDLTANVDFAYFKEALAGLRVTSHGPLTQSTFLTRMGLNTRIEALKMAASSNERKEVIESAAKRLVDPTGMGTEYLVLGIKGEMDHGSSKGKGIWPFVDMGQIT